MLRDRRGDDEHPPPSNAGSRPRIGILQTDGKVTEHALPNANSGPTTIALAPDGTLWFTEASGNRIGRMNPDGSGLVEYPLPNRRQLAADHRARRRRQHVVLGAHGQPHGPHHAARRARGVSDSDAEQPAACDRARRRRQHLVRDVRGRQDRPHHSGRRDHGVRDSDAEQRSARARRGSRRQHLVLRVSREQDRPHHARGRDHGVPAAAAELGPRATSPRARTATCGSSSSRAGWTDCRRTAIASAASRSTARSPSSRSRARAGSPTNVAVGPDRNVWYTKGAALGRVTPDGAITEFPLGASARAVGLTAGSDRQPPARLTNRLWFADGAGNKIGYLSFE